MRKAILYTLTTLATSLFLFPFILPLPGVLVNTKMVLAVLGGAAFALDGVRRGGLTVSRDFLMLSLVAGAVSLWAYLILQVNHSSDTAFATWFLSVWVWLAAAYAVVRLIGAAHGKATVENTAGYILAACTAQCVLAYAMTLWAPLKDAVDAVLGDTTGYMGTVRGRLYGLGAALDPAGLRFGAALILAAYVAARTDFSSTPGRGTALLLSYAVVAVIGNMVARSTTVGLALSVPLFLWLRRPHGGGVMHDRAWVYVAAVLAAGALLSVALYHISPSFRENLRFGFEGFFSLAETGRWQTHSTDVLRGMVVWPETLHTWVLGDGHFASPQDMPDRYGQIHGGFYMGTDIGYLRYIFYFGVIGLIGMVAAFVQMALTIGRRLPGCAALAAGLLLVNLLGWLKVSSDIIMVLAPLLVLAYTKDQEN